MLSSQISTEYEPAGFRELETAIEAIESYRPTLGDEIVEVAVSLFAEQIHLLRQQEEAARQQRKFVSVLFVDITNSVSLAQQLGDDKALLFLEGALERFEHMVEKNGGRVLKILGDGLMAVFGIPFVRENDAERAVLSGLDILAAAKRYGHQVKTTFGIEEFGIRVGIDTGPVIVGGGIDADQDATGMTVNLASRMEDAAPVSRMLITHNTYKQTYGLFNVRKRPLLKVSGKKELMQTYLVDAPRPPREFRMHRHGIAGLQTPLIGRSNDYHHLTSKYHETVQQKRANTITILGEPGIGKSRLLD